jgi:thiamine monophosphate synthase
VLGTCRECDGSVRPVALMPCGGGKIEQAMNDAAKMALAGQIQTMTWHVTSRTRSLALARRLVKTAVRLGATNVRRVESVVTFDNGVEVDFSVPKWTMGRAQHF